MQIKRWTAIVLSLLVIAGFFLPWFSIRVFDEVSQLSPFRLIRSVAAGFMHAEWNLGYIMLLVSMLVLVFVPVLAATVAIRCLAGFTPGPLRMLPFLTMILFLVLMMIGFVEQSSERWWESLMNMAAMFAYGFYLTLVAAAVLLIIRSRREDFGY